MANDYGKIALSALFDSYFIDCRVCNAVVLQSNVTISMYHKGWKKRWVFKVLCWSCQSTGELIVSYPRSELIEVLGDVKIRLKNDLDAETAISIAESFLAR